MDKAEQMEIPAQHDNEAEQETHTVDSSREVAIARMRSLVDTKFCENVASIIGEEARKEDVLELIALSNAGAHMFHGMNRGHDIPYDWAYEQDFVLPRGLSFWHAGRGIFTNGTPENQDIGTYKTCFFHYGHSYHHPSRRTSHTMMFITNPTLLRERAGIDMQFTPDVYDLPLDREIPRKAMHLLMLDIDRANPDTHGAEARRQGQESERACLHYMLELLRRGYEPGGITHVQLQGKY